MTLHVAVVQRPGRDYRSGRERGDWACFVGDDEATVVRQALKANEAWGGTYRILVGTLTGEVREPVSYEVVTLPEASS